MSEVRPRLLVKTLLNPLKRRFRMRFADILKPDFRGAVLAALAIDPAIVKLVFQGATFTLLWQLFRQKLGASTFAEPDGEAEEADLGFAGAIDLFPFASTGDLSPRSTPSADRLEEAILHVLVGDRAVDTIAQQYGIERTELERLATLFRDAGRAAIHRDRELET